MIYSSAKSLAAAIRSQQISSEEVVDRFLRRIEEINPKINAVVQSTAETALAGARDADAQLAKGNLLGPLHGVPFTVKDAFETQGVVSAGGTRERSSFIPSSDATIVARMRAAGAVLLGKTNVPELSLAYESDNRLYGRTNNPYDLSRTPGGSSGGEAALIAAGGSPLGLGSDTGGSIRVPAHFCGIAGLKPTTGRAPRTGHWPPIYGVLDTLTQVGPLAQTVGDLRLALSIISGPDSRDPGVMPVPLEQTVPVNPKKLRIAFHTNNGIIAPHPSIVEYVKIAADALSNGGFQVEEVRPGGIEQSYEIFLALFKADGGAGVRSLLDAYQVAEPHPLVQRLQEIQRTGVLTAPQFGALLVRWDIFRASMLSFFEEHDGIVSPVCGTLALPHSTSFDHLEAFSYTMTYSLTGWPSVVVRVGTSTEGLPIGVQVIAAPWREDVALAIAEYLESTLGAGPRPPLLNATPGQLLA